jgi:hypothetical protein
MSVNLRSNRGKSFSTSAGHWAVYLNVAQYFGWKPAGTLPPDDWPQTQQWTGKYDSNDGQRVSEDDAKHLAQILHAAAAGPDIGKALSDVIKLLEASAEGAGISIPPNMHMTPEEFSGEFSPLLFLLYDGEFIIE